jgi:3D (Asp-Asp-Asp) domain-containing protein
MARTLVRLVTVLAVFFGLSFVQLSVSQAIEVPETLADRRPVGVHPVVPDFSIDHLGVLWETRGTADEHADEEAEGEHGAVRFRVDGAWTAWQALTEDGAHAEGQWASALVPGRGAEAYQVRGVPADAVAPRAVALNTTDGPLVEVGRRPAGEVAQALTTCLSREEWGADESLRFDRRGNEIWPPEFYPVQTMTVHHTATKNDDPDPDATVRAIYRYHAVDRGWGDIGYHYLIDEGGRVYEGRWSGEKSADCRGQAGGTDFAHDDADGLVTAGHTGGYNSGNMGAAVLGTFTTADDPSPKAAAVDALENLLAEFGVRHQLDPHAVVDYVNPVDGATKTVNMISGHKDWKSTECPGEKLYALLPDIRDAVKQQMADFDAVPQVGITSPEVGATVEGLLAVSGTAGDDKSLAQVEVFVDSTSLGMDSESPDTWSFGWDTTAVTDGTYRLTATATDSSGQQASHTVSVTVDNVADPLSLSAVDPSSGKQNSTVTVTITGAGFVSETGVDLQNGEGTQPVVLEVGFLSSKELTVTLEIGKTPGPRKDRPWDVVVTNPDGTSAVLDDGFTVLR